MHQGDPIRARASTTNASSGVALDVYLNGSSTALTIAANQYLAIDSVQVALEDGGAFHVFIGEDATPDDDETVARGTFPTTGATSGIFTHTFPTPIVPVKGGKPWIVADVGQADVVLTGTLMEA